jgi:mono/diheme cytochrome c family protein
MMTHSFMNRSASSRRMARLVAATSLVGLAVALPVGSPRSIGGGLAQARSDDPPADRQDDEEQEATRQVLRDNCLICHSDEMVASQRLTRPQWKTEVEKMVGWGSPLPPDQVEPLTKFLAEHFSDSTPPSPPVRMTYAQAFERVKPDPPGASPLKGDSERGAPLYAQHCATCHGPDGQGADLGPNLVEVAVLLRQAEFREVTRDGRHRMPGFKNVLTPDQETDILVWLRSRRFLRTLPPK